ncbi:MAG: hypothetical protein WBF93_16885, partial [Pirellulales bacterium]
YVPAAYLIAAASTLVFLTALFLLHYDHIDHLARSAFLVSRAEFLTLDSRRRLLTKRNIGA